MGSNYETVFLFCVPRFSYDSESTDTLLDAHQMNDGSITPNSVSTMGSDNYYMSAKQSDAPTPTPPPTGGAGGGNNSKERKKHDRFNGMSEEEVCKRTLPDHLDTNLDVVIVSTVDFQPPFILLVSLVPTLLVAYLARTQRYTPRDLFTRTMSLRLAAAF